MVKLVISWACILGPNLLIVVYHFPCISLWVTTTILEKPKSASIHHFACNCNICWSRSPSLQAARGDFAAMCDSVWSGAGTWLLGHYFLFQPTCLVEKHEP